MENDAIPVEKVFNRTPIKFTHNGRVIHGEISGHPDRDLHYYSRDTELLKLVPNGHITIPIFILRGSPEEIKALSDLIDDLTKQIAIAWKELPQVPASID